VFYKAVPTQDTTNPIRSPDETSPICLSFRNKTIQGK